MMIGALETPRLKLIPAPAETLELLVAQQYIRAGATLGVEIPEGWPYEPEAMEGIPWHLRALQADPSAVLWRVRLIVLRAENRVIGSVNLKGQPAVDGSVEIGWGVTAAYRRQGVATEAAQAVIAWTMGQSPVRCVVATIPPDNPVSQRVAVRIGMTPTEETRRGLPVWELRNDRCT